MARGIICLHCGGRNIAFSGVLVSIHVRSSPELLAPFTCGNSHAFFLPLGVYEEDDSVECNLSESTA
jgi:hypothetical protein